MALSHRFFITGTDTDCGKTLVTRGFMQLCRQRGMTTAGMKPVASGGMKDDHGILTNDDALAIQSLCSTDTDYELINPFCYAHPIAPHLAAELSGSKIELPTIHAAYNELAQHNECLIVEGVGGWRVPLNEELDIGGLCQALELPAVLVVGMKLGCINHALLSAQAIIGDDVPLLGWVANCVDPAMQLVEQNISTLRQHIPAPLLGIVPFLPDRSPTLTSEKLTLPDSAFYKALPG